MSIRTGVVFPGHQVVAFKGPPKLVGLNAHDGIGGLVEILPPPEHLRGDGVALDPVRLPGQGLYDHVLQKLAL